MFLKFCANDIIPTDIFKKCLPYFVHIIVDILNLSFSQGVFPAYLRHAIVTPVYKRKGSELVLSNYRPISSLPVLSKIIEKTIHQQLLDHISCTLPPSFNYYQSAYKQFHSTETALLRIKNDIIDAMDGGQVVYMVQLDLSAAFDTVDHQTLIRRLGDDIGLTSVAVQLIESYLSDRTQSVTYNGKISKPLAVKWGVPQGSVLGPILFNLYVNPLYSVIEKFGLQYHAYADDLHIYGSCYYTNAHGTRTGPDILKRKIELCIMEIQCWANDNKLSLNPEKTEFCIFSTKCIQDVINVCGQQIYSSTTIKSLGVHFDQRLTMNDQIISICRYGYAFLRGLRYIRRALDTKSIISIVNSFVVSKIDYCNSLLYGITAANYKRLQKLQNTAARLITNTNRRQSAKPLLQQLHWLPIEYRIKFKIAYLTYICHHFARPIYLCSLLRTRTHLRTLRSCNNNHQKYEPARCRLKVGEHRFSVAGPTIWNALPSEVTACANLDIFKKRLKAQFFTQYFND